jgi:hypothetical protein
MPPDTRGHTPDFCLQIGPILCEYGPDLDGGQFSATYIYET